MRKPDNKETESGAGATEGPGLSAVLPDTFEKNLMHTGVSGEVPPRFDFSLEKWWIGLVADIGQGMPGEGA